LVSRQKLVRRRELLRPVAEPIIAGAYEDNSTHVMRQPLAGVVFVDILGFADLVEDNDRP